MLKYILTLLIFIFSSCSYHADGFKANYDSGRYEKSEQNIQIGLKKDQASNILFWKINDGFFASSILNPNSESIAKLNSAEAIFNQYEDRGLLSSLMSNLLASITNELTIPYSGYIYEGTFLNLYKALIYIKLKDYTNARIEFNRANDRSRRAKDYYQKEILKSESNLSKEKAISTLKNLNAQLENDTKIRKVYSNLHQFSIYKDLVNPFVPYLSGLFFMQEKDFSKSIDLLKESYGITNSNLILGDINILSDRERNKFEAFTWFIIEDGDIARKDSAKLSVMLNINGPIFVTFLFPIFKNGFSNFNSYSVKSLNNVALGDKIVNVSALMASEFEKQLPFLRFRSIASTLVKLTSSISINKITNDSLLGGIFSFVLSGVSKLDTRSSILLPDSIHMVRVKNSDFENLTLFGNNTQLRNFEFTYECKNDPNYICKNTDNIVFVKVHKHKIINFYKIKGN